MKRILYPVSAMLLLVTIVLGACTKSSSTNNSIVGTWEVATQDNTTSTTSPASTVVVDTSYTHGHSIVIVINSNDTYVSTDNTVSPATTQSGTYSTALAGKLITVSSGSTPDTVNYVVAGNLMTITESSTFSGGSYSIKETLNRQ